MRLAQLKSLLHCARLGAQFPDPSRWIALCDLLQLNGPSGKPFAFDTSFQSGLITPRSMAQLHRLQFVAREFFAKHKARPVKESRAFSMALAALELPPTRETHARLINSTRIQLVHDQLGIGATRLTIVVEQRGRGPISIAKNQLATVNEALATKLMLATTGSIIDVFDALVSFEQLSVIEITRAVLGPLFPLPDDRTDASTALTPLCRSDDDAILNVTLQRMSADVAKSTVRDVWEAPPPGAAGMKIAHERRLFCTPSVEASLRALTGTKLLVRAS